jgi:putative hydrolase of the HAD superfamily
VFFDLDDTVFDHAGARRAALRLWLIEHPRTRKRTLEEVDRRYQVLLDAIHPKVLAGKVSSEVARVDRFELLARWMGAPSSRKEAIRSAARYRESYLRNRRAIPGARELMTDLHGSVFVGIITNNAQSEQEEKLRYLRLGGRVDLLVTSEKVGWSKPDPRIFETALRKASVPAEASVMVGDSLRDDVLGAHRSGLGAIWFGPRKRNDPRIPGVVRLPAFLPLERAHRVLRVAHRNGPPPARERRRPRRRGTGA